MAGNVLWTTIFNQQGNQSQELTRQRIVQEERCGRRPATVTPGPEYDKLVRGQGKLLDPWAPPPDAQRSKIQPPLVGYGGTVPRLRPEHTGKNRGEQAAHFVPHFGSAGHAKMKREAPAGGASALGSKPFESECPASSTLPVEKNAHTSLLLYELPSVAHAHDAQTLFPGPPA